MAKNFLGTLVADDDTRLSVFVSGPSGSEPATLTKEDVWGEYDDDYRMINPGMIVARSGDTCPIFGDEVPYKSVTVVCLPEQEADVTYWLEHVHGSDCLNGRANLKSGRIALRSDYMCW